MPATKVQLDRLLEKYQRFLEQSHAPAKKQSEREEDADKKKPGPAQEPK